MRAFLQKLKEKKQDLNINKETEPIRIVFICTANCSRSPIAEILFEKILIEELGSLKKLAEKNIRIESAATKYSGLQIALDSAAILMEEENISENRCHIHRGRHISEIDEPDLLLTMTDIHVSEIISQKPEWERKTFTLKGFVSGNLGETDENIEDPIAGPLSGYRYAKDQIKSALYLLLKELKDVGLI